MSDASIPRILTVDDEEIILHSFHDYLEKHDYEVICAESGEKGLELFQSINPDLLLVDLRMPGVDGFQVLSEAKNLNPDIPVIVVSGTERVSDVVRALKSGADDYLIKPLEDFSVLLHAVKSGLEKSRLKMENRAYRQHLEELVSERTRQLRQSNQDLQIINQRLRNLVDTTRKLAHCGNIEVLGSQLLEEFRHHMLATGGSLYLVQEKGLEQVYALDPGHAPHFIPFPLSPQSPFAQVLESGKALHLADLANHSEIIPSGWQGYDDGSILIFPLPDENGVVIGLLSLHSKASPPFVEQDREIGEILACCGSETLRAVKTTEALKEREELFRAISSSAQEAFLIADSALCLHYWNQAAERLFDRDHQSMNCLHLSEVLADEPSEYFDTVVRSLATQDQDMSGLVFKVNAQRRDGSIFPAEVSVSTLQLHNQCYVLSIFRDITERVQAEKEKKALEERFREAQRMESIGRLAGGVAHDFNNLLAPMLGYSEMILDELPDDSAIRGDLLIIQKAAEQARQLTQQMLAFSRKQVLEVKSMDLNDVIKNILLILQRTIREDIRINVHLAEKPLIVTADPAQLEQVMMNLVVNAQDALPDGGEITLSCGEIHLDDDFVFRHPGSETGQFAFIKVHDNGCGMSPEVLRRAFEPFYSTKEKGRGTGLGLSTVYGIVKQHNGYINISSQLGKCTCVTIYLLSSGELPDSSSTPKIMGPSDAAPPKPPDPQTVMVVEDNPLVREMTSSMLRKRGYGVFSASSAREALNRISNDHLQPDLLLTDLIMPEMNGQEFYTQAKQLIPDLKVLYMSGYADEVISHHGLLNEGTVLLKKPFTVEALIQKIHAAFE